jgi:hypothetical protein
MYRKIIDFESALLVILHVVVVLVPPVVVSSFYSEEAKIKFRTFVLFFIN